MAMNMRRLAETDSLESLQTLTATFIIKGDGFTSILPTKYLAPTIRLSKAEDLMFLVADYTCFRPNAIKTTVAINDDDTPVPVIPGAKPPNAYFNLRFKPTGSLVEHKDGFFVPGLLIEDAAEVQALGEAIADLLTTADCQVRFTRVSGS